jgi:hypothetical protein
MLRVMNIRYIMGRKIAECLKSVWTLWGIQMSARVQKQLPLTVQSSSVVHILWFSIPSYVVR